MARRRRVDGPRPLERPRLYESLAATITDFIEAQGLGPGDRLPPERQLAADLGVSRATLSRALAALETRGRIEVRHGVGALVSDPAAGPSSDAPGWDARLDDHARPEVLAAREAVLAGIARAAASHPDRTLRIALVGDDGRPPDFDDVWRCLRRLSGAGLLAELDDVLAPRAVPPPDGPVLRGRLARLAESVVAGDPTGAAAACAGLLDAD